MKQNFKIPSSISTCLDVEPPSGELHPGPHLVGEAGGVGGVVHGAGRGRRLRLEHHLLAILDEGGGLGGGGCERKKKDRKVVTSVLCFASLVKFSQLITDDRHHQTDKDLHGCFSPWCSTLLLGMDLGNCEDD